MSLYREHMAPPTDPQGVEASAAAIRSEVRRLERLFSRWMLILFGSWLLGVLGILVTILTTV